MDGFAVVAPGLKLVTPEQLTLLGSCVFDSNVYAEIGRIIPKLSLLCDKVLAMGWLEEAVPLASVGTLLTDEVTRIAVSLRLGLCPMAVDVGLWLMLSGDTVSFAESQEEGSHAILRSWNPPIFVD
ncbi:hypothetical protein ACOME3_003222 [Neoechinorhynchus agilis]